MDPLALFGIQFTLSLVAYALIALWYVAPRLAGLPRELALVPLLWVHVFRVIGGTILAPGSVDPGVPMEFRTMVGLGDVTTAVLAVLALVALRNAHAGSHRPGVALPPGWDPRHAERDRSVDPLRCVLVRARPELGDRHRVCARPARE